MGSYLREEIVALRTAALVSGLQLIDAFDRNDGEVTLINALEKLPGTLIRYANGTYEVRIGGIKASCTAGYSHALRAWARKARALDGEVV